MLGPEGRPEDQIAQFPIIAPRQGFSTFVLLTLGAR